MLCILHLISRVPRQLPLKGKPFTQHILRCFFIEILFIGKAYIEPRHYGGVFVIQKALDPSKARVERFNFKNHSAIN